MTLRICDPSIVAIQISTTFSHRDRGILVSRGRSSAGEGINLKGYICWLTFNTIGILSFERDCVGGSLLSISTIFPVKGALVMSLRVSALKAVDRESIRL